MNTKKLVKAFIAGLTLPAVVLPIMYTLLEFNVRNVFPQHTYHFIPMFLPLAWGLANAIFIYLHKEGSSKGVNGGLIVTGACLGFLVAAFVVMTRVPEMVFGRGSNLQYLPLIVAPVVYAILFRFVVKWLNKLIGV